MRSLLLLSPFRRVIPLNEHHLRRILTEWVAPYHRGRPHTSLGSGLREPPPRHTGHSRPGIISPTGTALRRRRFWPDCTMNIVWRKPRDPATECATLLRSTVVREPCPSAWKNWWGRARGSLRDAWLRLVDVERQRVPVLGDPGCEMIGGIQEPRVAARGREQHQASDGHGLAVPSSGPSLDG
jgi:hypothetical protein